LVDGGELTSVGSAPTAATPIGLLRTQTPRAMTSPGGSPWGRARLATAPSLDTADHRPVGVGVELTLGDYGVVADRDGTARILERP